MSLMETVSLEEPVALARRKRGGRLEVDGMGAMGPAQLKKASEEFYFPNTCYVGAAQGSR